MKHSRDARSSDFYVALGYKGEFLKRYERLRALAGSISVSLRDGRVTPLDDVHEHWNVNLIDPGNLRRTPAAD
jgi:hypothetical protein